MDTQNKYINSSDVLVTIVKEKEYIPLIKDFPIIDKQIPENFNFTNLFPELCNGIINLSTQLSSYIKETLPEFIQSNPTADDTMIHETLDEIIREFVSQNMKDYEKEIIPIMGQEWNGLNSYFNGKTKVHILLTLSLSYVNIKCFIDASKFSDCDKNLIYWIALVHDIAKHQKLNISLNENFDKRGVDRAHPFKSGALILKIFQRNNFFKFSTDEEGAELDEEIEKAYNYLLSSNEIYNDPAKSTRIIIISNIDPISYNISFIYLDQIIFFLKYLKKLHSDNDWIYDILTCVIFHQSIPNNDNDMNSPLLPNETIKDLFDQRLLEIMRVIMICDSASHSLSHNDSWTPEINKHIDQLREMYSEK